MSRRYLCAAGKPTIGYDHVIQASELHLNTATLTEPEASKLLEQDVARQYGAHVASHLKWAVSQAQFDALVSLCFNIGTGGFDQSSVLWLANAGSTDTMAICAVFGLRNKVTSPNTKQKEINKGLTVRRTCKAALYLSK
jgi:GH24 family phage-related lysozyme (muramidase)